MNKYPLHILIICLLFTYACTGGDRPVTAGAKEAAKQDVYYPYVPRKDIRFGEGRPDHARTVLQIWKGYESGSFKNYEKYFADSLTLVFNDRVLKGKKEATLSDFQKWRDRLATIQCHVDFWQPVYAAEEKEHWVLLWAKHEGTRHDKKLESYSVQQVWKFNTSGKIYFMQEYKSIFYWQ